LKGLIGNRAGGGAGGAANGDLHPLSFEFDVEMRETRLHSGRIGFLI